MLGRPARSADWKALPSVSGCSRRVAKGVCKVVPYLVQVVFDRFRG
jgi:hypothetical protein